MDNNMLIAAGLTQAQAQILSFLFENGECRVSFIMRKTNRPRGVIYKVLADLEKMELVKRKDSAGEVSVFVPEHPGKIEDLFGEREKNLKQSKKRFAGILPDLLSAYNLASNKPGIKYYEGIEGVIRVLGHISDKFKPDSEIVSFVKVLPAEFEKGLNEAFEGFIKKRIRMNVKTRVLAVDAPEAIMLKKGDEKALRETRLIKVENTPLDFPGGEIFIYGSEICAVMMERNTYFAFMIQSKSIAQFLKVFFVAEWELLSSGNTTDESSVRKSSEDVSFSKIA